MEKVDLIGKEVRIMNRKDEHYGKWATILSSDGKLYKVKLKNPPHLIIEMARSEFWVVRGGIQ